MPETIFLNSNYIVDEIAEKIGFGDKAILIKFPFKINITSRQRIHRERYNKQ